MKQQIRKVVSLLLALTMILSTMPLASATMVAHVIKSAVLEPNNTADIQYSAVGEALVVRENVYDNSGIWQPSRVVYEAADGSFQLSEAQSGELYYTNVRGYVYSYNTYKYINIKTGEASLSTDAILQNREDPGIHPAYSATAGGMRYYRGTDFQVSSTDDSERTLAFEGVYDTAGEFSDSKYARVTSIEQVQIPADYVTNHTNIEPDSVTVNKNGSLVSFTITDHNLQSSYPCNQSFTPDSAVEHGWIITFGDGTYTFQIGTLYFAQANQTAANKTLPEMQSSLWVSDNTGHHNLLYANAELSISGTEITWSVDTDTIAPSQHAVDDAAVPADYKITPDNIAVTGGKIDHKVAAGTSGSQAAPATTVTQNVYQIINKSGDVVYTDDGSGVLATHYIWSEFHNDMLLVTEPDTYQKGYMDETGTLVIPCVYADAYDFHNGYARVDSGYYSADNQGRSMSLIDTSGNTIIPEGTYDVITDVDSDGMLWAVRDDTVYHLRIVAPSSGSGGGGGGATVPISGGEDIVTVTTSVSGGSYSFIGVHTYSTVYGTVTAADATAQTVTIDGVNYTYATDFVGTPLSEEVIGCGVEVHLNRDGKIAGYNPVYVYGKITEIDEESVTINGIKYNYNSGVGEQNRIPLNRLDSNCDLYLDGKATIIWWYVEGTSFSGGISAVSDDGFIYNGVKYSYADNFAGDKLQAGTLRADVSISLVGGKVFEIREIRIGGNVTEADANSVTIRAGNYSLNYSYADSCENRIRTDTVKEYAELYLNAAGKVVDFYTSLSGQVVGADNDGVTLKQFDYYGEGTGNETYGYNANLENKLTGGAVSNWINLDLDSNYKITWWQMNVYGTIINAETNRLTVRRYDFVSGIQKNYTYTYSSDFDGTILDSNYSGRNISFDLDASGKIRSYQVHPNNTDARDYVEIVSVNPEIIGRGETVSLEVTVRYRLSSAENGIVYLGINSAAMSNYSLKANQNVVAGEGVVTLTADVTTATDWDTIVYANLSEAGHDDNWTPLAAAAYLTESTAIDAGTCGASANWTLNSAGTLTISGTGAMADYGYDNESRAPWYSYASSIKRVVIQSGITRIGSCAFDQCINLADVSIPDTVTTIGNNSFQLCGSLTSISFPNSLKTIEHSVFFGSGLTSVTVPDSVTRIDNSAFSGCADLESVTLGSGLSMIDEYMFMGDTKLSSFTVPAGVTTIKPYAFDSTGIKKFSVAAGNSSFKVVDGVLYNADVTTLIYYPPKSELASLVLPDTVTSVDLKRFIGTSISEIRIPQGATMTNSYPSTGAIDSPNNIKLYFEGDIPADAANWRFYSAAHVDVGVTPLSWTYDRAEHELSNAVLYVPYYANTVSAIDDDSLDPPFYASGLVDTGLEVDITGGFVTGAPLATGKTIFTVSSGAKTYTFSVTTRENNTTTVTAETSEDLVIEKTVSNMTTSTVSDQVFEIEDKDKDETTEVKSNFEKFLDVYLDGVKLVGGKIEPDSTDPDAIKSVANVPDDWEYYAEEGSTKITVRAQTFQNKTAGTHTIAATFEKTVVDPVTQVETREVITAAQNFAITTSDGGGNGGGGGSSTGAAQQPAAETKTPELSYSVTNGVAALDSTSVTQMAASATEQKSDTLTLDLTNGGETVTAVSLPAGLMDQIAQLAASGENSVDSLAIVLTSGSLELDAETLSEIAQQAGGESISMALEEVSADQLSDGQQAALAELSAEKIISIEISCADKQITDFGGGRVNLSIPFTAAADKNARGYAVWHLADDGKTSRHSTGYADGKISFRTAHFSNYAVAYREPNLFTDVLDGLWYTNDVDHVAALGIMNGVNGTKFAPNTALTRAMFAQIIYNAENGTAGAPSSFSDVPDGMWYTDAVNWAAQNRIVSGIGNSQYAPDREITREELVMMLYNYATYKGYDAKTDVELTRFSDSSSVSTWAETAMKWAVRNKLINGVGEKLLTGDKATRAQVAKVMAYFLEQYAR